MASSGASSGGGGDMTVANVNVVVRLRSTDEQHASYVIDASKQVRVCCVVTICTNAFWESD
jgi:hypothetical protein